MRGTNRGQWILVLLCSVSACALFSSCESRKRGITDQESARIERLILPVALRAFREKFGEYPAASLTLVESPRELPDGAAAAAAWQSSIAGLRRVWPKFSVLPDGFDLDCDGHADVEEWDFNGNGQLGEVLELDGSECLVFFLCGRCGDQRACRGLADSPCNPLECSERMVTFHEFDRGRLRDPDGDGFYSYFSAVDGEGPITLETLLPDR